MEKRTELLRVHPGARAVVLIVHGMGEYAERYGWLVDQLYHAQYTVWVGDLPGHGGFGILGHLEDFREYLLVLENDLLRLQAQFPKLPIVLFGHSMGGLIVLRYLQELQKPTALSAVTLSSPALDVAIPISKSTLRLAGVLSSTMPRLRLSTRIQAKDVTRNLEIQHAYTNEQRVLKKASVRFLHEFFKAMDTCRRKDIKLEIPVLWMQAGADRVVSVIASRAGFERLQAADKTYREYPDCYHELFNEPNRMEIFHDWLRWLEEHIPGAQIHRETYPSPLPS